MSAIMPAPKLLIDLAQRGFSLRIVAGKVVVTPASRLTPQDRDAIGTRRAEILAVLSPCEPWNAATAHRLMAEADAFVAQVGVSGQHPRIVTAAAMVISALATRDLETLRFAFSEFTALIRTLATAKAGHREKL